MFDASVYFPVYMIVVTVISLIVYGRYKSRVYSPKRKPDSSWEGVSLALSVLLSLFIGSRPESGVYFGDTASYAQVYYRAEGLSFVPDWSSGDPIFSNFLLLVASARLGTRFLFTVTAFVYFMLAYAAIRKMFPKDCLAVYLVFLAALSTFSYGVNGIRCGAAASLFLFALAYRKKWYICILFVLIAVGIHHAMQLPAGALVLSLVYKNTKVYYAFWVACLLIAILHITVFPEMLSGLTNEGGASYLQYDGKVDWGGKSGFRWDFVLYSSVPLVMGYYVIFKKKVKITQTYSFLLNMYLITNGIWMLCMYASFTNRIAYLSWFIHPILLAYPYLREETGKSRYRTFSKIMLYNLLFTLFLVFVYDNIKF